MLQIGNPTETLSSAKPRAERIIISAPSNWQSDLTTGLKDCFDSFTFVDLLDNDIERFIQQIQLKEFRNLAAILLIVPRNADLSEILPGPCLFGVPVGILLADHSEELKPWLQAIRDTQYKLATPSYQVLSMWKPFYLRWASRFVSAFSAGFHQNGAKIIPLFADNTSRDELCEALWDGPQLALYVGHGRSRGWSGYRGLRWEHIASKKQIRAVGSLIALTCDNLKPGREGKMAFGARWVYEGRAGAFVGAVDSIEVVPLEFVAQFFLTHIASAEFSNLGQLIAAVDRDVCENEDPAVHENWKRFRIIGNPLQVL